MRTVAQQASPPTSDPNPNATRPHPTLQVRSVAQQAALLALTQYMGGVYEEMSSKLGALGVGLGGRGGGGEGEW